MQGDITLVVNIISVVERSIRIRHFLTTKTRFDQTLLSLSVPSCGQSLLHSTLHATLTTPFTTDKACPS